MCPIYYMGLSKKMSMKNLEINKSISTHRNNMGDAIV
jgi:hypothetical protein